MTQWLSWRKQGLTVGLHSRKNGHMAHHGSRYVASGDELPAEAHNRAAGYFPDARGRTGTLPAKNVGVAASFTLILGNSDRDESVHFGGVMTDREPSTTRPNHHHRPLGGRRILIVDNDSDTLQILKFVLEQNGAHVVATDTVLAALEEFESRRPDVILADIAMPDLNGYALISEVRRLDAERGSHTKAIAVTAFATERDEQLAESSGFERYIAKPFDPRALVETVVQLIQ